MKTGLDVFEACSTIEGWDGKEVSEQEVIDAYQFLIDTGVIWQLQGWYGRNAARLIQEGLCHERKR